MNKVASEFEGKLMDMVNYIIKKTVSLQVRDIFVMYLPNKQRNGKTYYVFNIYLYNTTGNIKFSQAITEMKDFVTGMKSKAYLTLSNGINVDLKIGFAHNIRLMRPSIDLSVGKSLVQMDKTAWGQRIERPDFEITDVHWCYRTGFSLSDITVIGVGVMKIHVAPTVTIYGTEIEEGWLRSKGKIYICIELVVPPTTRDDLSPTPNTEGKEDIVDDDDKGVLDDKGGVLVVSCVVFAIFGIIFCKVRVHIQAAKRKINTDMLANQSTIELDTINNKPEQSRDHQDNMPV